MRIERNIRILEVGDIIIYTEGSGHVAMVYEVNGVSNGIEIVHALEDNDFHITFRSFSHLNYLSLTGKIDIFGPTWHLLDRKMGHDKLWYQLELQKVARIS